METITWKEYLEYQLSIATEKSEVERLKKQISELKEEL